MLGQDVKRSPCGPTKHQIGLFVCPYLLGEKAAEIVRQMGGQAESLDNVHHCWDGGGEGEETHTRNIVILLIGEIIALLRRASLIETPTSPCVVVSVVLAGILCKGQRRTGQGRVAPEMGNLGHIVGVTRTIINQCCCYYGHNAIYRRRWQQQR